MNRKPLGQYFEVPPRCGLLLLARLLLARGFEVLGGKGSVLLLDQELDLLLRLVEDRVALAQRLDARLVLLDRFLELELAALEGLHRVLDLGQIGLEGLLLHRLVGHRTYSFSTREMIWPAPR